MTDEPDSEPAIDDPEWLDRIVASALERVDTDGSDGDIEPEPTETGVAAELLAASNSIAPPLEDDPPSPIGDVASAVEASDPAPVVDADAGDTGDPLDDAGRGALGDTSVFGEGDSAPVAFGVAVTEGERERTTAGTVVIDPADLVIDSGETTDGRPTEDGSSDTDDPGSIDEHRGGRWLLEWGVVIFAALAVAFLIRVFLLQAFSITSVSMEPTLNDGDRVMVNKISYDLHDVNFGDIIVFNRPPDEPGAIDDLIKRVIATGGQTVDIRDGDVYVEGRLVVEPYLGDGVRTSPGIRRAIIESDACVNSGGTSCTIPEDMVFVLGDNRVDSFDSRNFGPIAEDLIVGRAFLKFWPISEIEPL